jgi:allantoinase
MTQGIYDTTQPYPRDLIGYGRKPPQAKWPGGARIAVQFVLNYEEGGENAVLHGDPGSEQFLSEMFNPASFPDRHLSMEGIYEYGSRVGVWRLLREFEKRGLPLTVFGVGMALQRHPELTAAFVELGHEIACHGWRWISYQNVDEATEREHMRLGMKSHRGPHRQSAIGLVHRARQPADKAAWWPTTAASPTTATTTATTSPSG